MQQDLLADAGAANRLAIRFNPTFSDWRAHARHLLAAGKRPGEIWWTPEAGAPSPESDRASLDVPRRFVDSAKLAACHRADDRWALLYEILWRLTHGEPHLMSVAGDDAVVRLHRYEKAIRRDHHKMKAFLRFRESETEEGTRYIAWFEPTHYIVDLAAEFFRRRYTNMKWSILTPYRSAHWEGEGEVWFSGGADRSLAPEQDRFESAWQSYYRSTFNPARIKVQAMQSEMPQKYWHNLPEAREITRLLVAAQDRTTTMINAPAGNADLRCGERPASWDQLIASQAASEDAWERLSAQLESCSSCDHCSRATQVVHGEGSRGADIMLVGEQPGDREDLVGRPFVGPAGKVLDDALRESGLDRSALYLTNAVKHFRYRSNGKRRLHENPREGDIHQCRPFLLQEIALVQPKVVVCLGRTAARAILGQHVKVSDVRGQLIRLSDNTSCLVTAHPASILRSRNESATARQHLVRDLSVAVSVAQQPVHPGSRDPG